MPTSSTRNTWIEKQLILYYKQSFTRLYCHELQAYALFVNKEFANVLDMTEGEMFAKLKQAPFDPLRMSWGEYEAEGRFMGELQESTRRAPLSDRLCWAGNTLADAGAALAQVGRTAEAAQFCEWGSELWQLASDTYDREQRYQQRNGVAHDVEMD